MIEHDGKLYARVSEVIAPLNDFGRIPFQVLENKARIGTETHDAIEKYILTKECIFINDDCMGYFESFKRWWDLLQYDVVITEQRLFCDKLRITGKMDALISKNGQIPLLLDYKTSVKESPTWRLQAHLYRHLLNVNEIETQLEMWFVKLDKNGKLPKLFIYKHDQEIHDSGIAMCKNFWRKMDSLFD